MLDMNPSHISAKAQSASGVAGGGVGGVKEVGRGLEMGI